MDVQCCTSRIFAIEWGYGVPVFSALFHSFIHERTDLGGVMSNWLQGHLTTSNEKTKFAAEDENGLSCAMEVVRIASGKKECLELTPERSRTYAYYFLFLQRVRIARNADRCNSTADLSVRLSVCHVPVFVQTNEDIRSCGLQYLQVRHSFSFLKRQSSSEYSQGSPPTRAIRWSDLFR